MHVGVEAVKWLDEPTQAASLALLPLRTPGSAVTSAAFGLLVLASPDSQRFTDDMATDFLQRIADIASAALSPLVLPRAVAATAAPVAEVPAEAAPDSAAPSSDTPADA